MNKLLTILAIILVLIVIGTDIKTKTTTQSEEDAEIITWRPNTLPPDNSFVMTEVYTALQHVYDEYGYPFKVAINLSLHEDAKEAIDIRNQEKYYTRVYLSEDGRTLYVSSEAFFEKPNSFPPILESLITEEVANKYYK